MEEDSVFESYKKWFGSDAVSLDNIFSSLDPKWIFDIIKKSSNLIKIEQSKEKLTVLLSYNINDFNSIHLKRFEILNDVITMHYMEDSIISYIHEKQVTEQYFFRVISEYFTDIFYFTIIEYCFTERERRKAYTSRRIVMSKNNLVKQMLKIEHIEKLFSPEFLKRTLMFKHSLSRSLYVQQNRLADFEKYIGYQLKSRGITNLPIEWD